MLYGKFTLLVFVLKVLKPFEHKTCPSEALIPDSFFFFLNAFLYFIGVMSSKNSIVGQSRVTVSLAALNRRCNTFHDTASDTLQCLLKLIQLKLLPRILTHSRV